MRTPQKPQARVHNANSLLSQASPMLSNGYRASMSAVGTPAIQSAATVFVATST